MGQNMPLFVQNMGQSANRGEIWVQNGDFMLKIWVNLQIGGKYVHK